MITIRTATAASAAALVLAAACDTSAPAAEPSGSWPSPPPVVKVAFVKDLSVPDADEHALPALQAARLAFETARTRDPGGVPAELEEFDLSEDVDELLAIQGDTSFVAAIVAPGVDLDASLGLHLPVVSLSGLDGDPAGQTWLRMVSPLTTSADVLARRVRRASVCVFSEDPAPDPFASLLAERLPGATTATIEPSEAGAVARDAGCDVVVWAGGPDAGAEAALALGPASVTLIGGDRLMDPDFLAAAGPAAEGAFALCPCADVSTSTEFATRRFIQDYQSEHGTAPGPYAVEAWDAAHVILRALDEGGPTRQAVDVGIGGMSASGGLAGIHRFGPEGRPVNPRALLRLYRLEGGRWVEASWADVKEAGVSSS